MPSPYNDVELTEAEKNAIYENPGIKEDQNPKERGIGEDGGFGDQPHSDESPEKEPKEEVKSDDSEGASEALESDEFNLEDYEVEIDGEIYDGADIMRWRDDSTNKEHWQRSNTQEAQKIAPWSKLSKKLESDDEFRGYVKDYFYDDEKSLKALGLNQDLRPIDVEPKQDSVKEPENNQALDKVEERLNEMELERVVDDLELELDHIIDDNQHLFGEEGSDVEFLEFVETSGIPDLNQAFKIWSYDKMEVELDHHKKLDGNRMRNKGKVVHDSEAGAQEESRPTSYKSVKDISIDDPDVAKYFNR